MDKKGEQVINWDTQIVPEGQRDEAFKQLKTINKNNVVFQSQHRSVLIVRKKILNGLPFTSAYICVSIAQENIGSME